MLTVITGPMFAGKTSKLLSILTAHTIAGDNVLVFKPANDTRYRADKVVSHDGETIACEPISPKRAIDDYLKIVYKQNSAKMNVIAFDEAQFFDDSIVDAVSDCMTWTHTIVAGLKEDSSGNPFGSMPRLLALADNIICLRAVCSKCKKIDSATRTYRKNESEEQVLVGGSEIYEPRCLDCWL